MVVLLLAGVLLVFRRPAADPGHGAADVVYGPEPVAGNARRVHEWSFAIHPLHNPSHLTRTYQPLLDTISPFSDSARMIAQPSRDYASYEAKIRTGEADFLLPNPWQTLLALEHGYRVIAMAGRPEDFRGLIIARKDRGLREFSQLRGQVVAYPSPTALAACVMPQWMMHEHGLDVTRDVDNRYVGSQHSAIMHAYLGEAAAGVTWPPPWRNFQEKYPEEAATLEVVWETPSLVNNAVMAHRRVPDEVARAVAGRLCALAESGPGRALLAAIDTDGFYPATDADYEPVRRFVERFEAGVRPVKSAAGGALTP